MSDIIKSIIELEKAQKKNQMHIEETIREALEDFKLGNPDYLVDLLNFIVQLNLSMGIKLLELEKELGDFKKEFSTRELNSQKFQDLLMSDEEIEE